MNSPPYLKKFIKEFPSVNARVEYRRANLFTKMFSTVLLTLSVAFPSEHKELVIEPFANDELIVAMSPENKLAQKKILPIENLNGEDLVAFEKDIPTRKATDEILSNAGVEVCITMEFDNVETVKRALEINAGLAISTR